MREYREKEAKKKETGGARHFPCATALTRQAGIPQSFPPCATIRLDSLLMLGIRARKDMAPGSIGNEIEILMFVRIQDSQDRLPAGTADGTRRKPIIEVGVVRRVVLQV